VCDSKLAREHAHGIVMRHKSPGASQGRCGLAGP
jgi:hypothetical protein